ncbi:MAG: Flp family type IVb pilin [Solirubrobacteraceae bacterium]
MNSLFYLYDIVSMMLTRLRREDGQTMAEYGILIAVIALIVVVAAVVLGSSISTLFSSTATKV